MYTTKGVEMKLVLLLVYSYYLVLNQYILFYTSSSIIFR